MIPKSSLPEGTTIIDVYLRSAGEGWEISCNGIKVSLIYSRRLEVTEKQLEKPSVLRKKSRRPTVEMRL